MPAGCEFICKNDKCEQYMKGFSITSPWPMGRIELIINSKRVKENKEFRDFLITLKDNGEKLARIQLPDIDDIPVCAYKVSFWSDEAKCIYNYLVETQNLDDFDEKFKNANIPEKCPKTGGELKSFDTVIKDGINCPFCKEKMEQNRWFSNAK